MKSGMYVVGYKPTLKMFRQGKAKLVILASNCPALRKSEIEYYAMLAKTGVHYCSGNSIELGTACGNYHRVCTLTVIDPGDWYHWKHARTDWWKINCVQFFFTWLEIFFFFLIQCTKLSIEKMFPHLPSISLLLRYALLCRLLVFLVLFTVFQCI